MIFAAASPIVHSKYLRQLEGTNSSDYEMTSSPDETSFSDEEEIPLPTEIILYSVVVLFGIMCVTSVLHSFARDCLGYTGQVQPEPQGGAEESATLQRRKILDIVFSETNLFQKVAPESPKKPKKSNSTEESPVIVNVETSEVNSGSDECISDDQTITTKNNISAPDSPNTVSTDESGLDIEEGDDDMPPLPSLLCIPELATESDEHKENSLKPHDDFPDVKKNKAGLYSSISQNDELVCSICLDGYESDDAIIQSKNCSHYFHKECILEWLVKSDECPCCREDMMSEEEVEEAADKIGVKKDDVQMIRQSAPQGISIRPVVFTPRSSSIPFYYPA